MTFERSEMAGIADEYVLGLLDDATQQRLERELERDPDLKAVVAASRERFLPLDIAVTPAEVRAGLWDEIDASLPRQEHQTEVAPLSADNDNSRSWWRIAALSAIASTVCLAIGLAFAVFRTTEPVVIAVLLNAQGEIHAVVEDFGNQNARVTLLKDFDVPKGKIIQAWTLPSPEVGPVSIGLLKDGASGTLDLPPLPLPHQEQLYELTLENEGGSPTGRPTGMIIAKGFAKLPL